ncbi:restriction endonuclease [Pseudonocardiaceae bacterium YIM PH 21723]|nr:restriction endonuclease [Pseudonocardiaceae bacterium YIM PH 21723]
MVSLPALRGYVLEEQISALLGANGYRLLTASDDEQCLRWTSSGLMLTGRGTDHQADALGELDLPTPFGLPVRLFVEAKYRESPVGLPAVRNAVGVLQDVNQRWSTGFGARGVPLRHFQYQYALFSTSGFTRDAQQFALAHQVSLIDLSGDAFASLRRVADDAARRLLFPSPQNKVPLLALREALRRELGSMPVPDIPSAFLESGDTEHLDRVARMVAANTSGELLFGFPRGALVLVMTPEDPEAVVRRLDRGEAELVVTMHHRAGQTANYWRLDAGDGFRLSFGLPPLIEEWLMSHEELTRKRTLQVKQHLLSSIAIYHRGRLVRLRYVSSRG